MPVHTAFDQMDDSGFTNRPKKMLWEIDLDDPRNTKNILDWLNGEQSFLTDENKERFQRIQRNIALYKGIQYQTQETRSDIRDRFDDKSRQYRKIVANHLFDLTTNRTSRLVKFKPAVAILPANNEFHDKVAAKSTKMLLDHIWYLQNFEGDKTIRIADLAHIMGESYLFICWNPDIGDIDSNFKKAESEAKKKGTKVRLRDENGAPAVDDLGNAIFLSAGILTLETLIPTSKKRKLKLKRKGLRCASVMKTEHLQSMILATLSLLRNQCELATSNIRSSSQLIFF